MSAIQILTSPDGVRLHVRSTGTSGGRPILFVHGFAQSLWCWTKQFAAPELRDYHLVAFDLRGHGRSDKPNRAGAYQSSEIWSADIATVIEGLVLEHRLSCSGPTLVWFYATTFAISGLALFPASIL